MSLPMRCLLLLLILLVGSACARSSIETSGHPDCLANGDATNAKFWSDPELRGSGVVGTNCPGSTCSFRALLSFSGVIPSLERSDEVEIIAEYAVLDLDRGAIGLSHPWILLVSKEALTAPSYAVRPTSGKDLQIKLPRTLKPGLGWKLSSEGLAHCEEVSSLAAQPSRVAVTGS